MDAPIDVVSEFGRRWAAHDLTGTLAMITEDCVFESTGPAPDGVRYVGHRAIADAWQPIFDNRSSVFTVEDTIEAGQHVIQQWHYDWGSGHVRGIDVFRVVGDRVAEKLSYVKG